MCKFIKIIIDMDNVNQKGAEEKVNSWISEINQISEKFLKEFSNCKEKFLLKPSENTWSIAENIQHIIEVNKSYFPLFTQLKSKTYKPSWSSRFSFINNLMGNLILKSVNEDRQKKIKTFPLWIPAKLPPSEDILSKFTAHQEELIGWIQNLKPFIDNNTVINSPANKLISYKLDDAIDIIIMHEKRHLNQAIEARQSI